ETVGAGQAEVEIARTAHTTVVIEAPSSGDDVQAIKAGILEAADVLVVNKADLPGADNAVRALQSALELARLGGLILVHGRNADRAASVRNNRVSILELFSYASSKHGSMDVDTVHPFAAELREQGRMDVKDTVGKCLHDGIRYLAHVAGKQDELNPPRQ
ncbi:MAG: hypothetical protein HGB35_07355, partial [Geobacteraceae bacterium]|nr:hypothetical protein [Geobacteraceae bacterium]